MAPALEHYFGDEGLHQNNIFKYFEEACQPAGTYNAQDLFPGEGRTLPGSCAMIN
jgi:hypothetical protein